MDDQVKQALDTALRNWNAMSAAEGDEAEEAANAFEASFYVFIDAVRHWVYGLEEQPNAVEELLALPMIEHIVQTLPPPLYLNFEMEAELIVNRQSRVDDEKYD